MVFALYSILVVKDKNSEMKLQGITGAIFCSDKNKYY